MIDFRKVPYSDDYTKQETDANTVGELFVLEALLMMNHVPTSQMAVFNKFATTKTGETKKNHLHTLSRRPSKPRKTIAVWMVHDANFYEASQFGRKPRVTFAANIFFAIIARSRR